MHTGKALVAELILEDSCRYARLSCPENLIPLPGQYLLARDKSDSPLPAPIFYTDSVPEGFMALAADGWKPGDELYLRGPLGRGFAVPASAHRIALIAFDDAPARLRGLIGPALRQSAAVVMVTNSTGDSLPDEVEVQPLDSMGEVLGWADYVAVDVSRENLSALKQTLLHRKQIAAVKEAQILIRTPMSCAGIAECGVCAVNSRSHWKMACKDGPVFDWKEI